MTRKHFNAIAAALAEAHAEIGDMNTIVHVADARRALDLAAAKLADVLQAENPRFDRDRFTTACRGES